MELLEMSLMYANDGFNERRVDFLTVHFSRIR